MLQINMSMPKSKIVTRHAVEQLAFGHPADLPVNRLPTQLDVAKSFLFHKRKWMIDNNAVAEPDNSFIANIVVTLVQDVYQSASIPTVRKDKIKEQILKVYDKRLLLQKIPASRRYKNVHKPTELTDFFIKKKEEFLSSISCLFDVADDKSVPKIEQEFLRDQRTIRKMIITSAIDKEATRKQQQLKEKRQAEATRIAKYTLEKRRNKETVYTGSSPSSEPCLDIFGEEVNSENADMNEIENTVFKEMINNPIVFGGGIGYDGRKDLIIMQKGVEVARMSELPTKRRRIYISDTKSAVQSRNATIASFRIANEFAKKRKSFEDEEMVKEMLLVVGESLFEGLSNKNDIITAIKRLNQSGGTLSRRIESISSDLEHQLQTDLHKCLWFSLQLDESTYMTDTSQLIVIVRMVFSDLSEKEELLKILPLKGTGGEDLFQTFRKYAEEINLPPYKLSSITTNGTLAMVDCINRFIAHYRKNASLPKFVSYHCIIHQEALCAEILQAKHIMDITTEIINAIQTDCLQHKLFKALVEDLDAEYNDHLLHTEGGWLSGKVLVRFLNLIEEIKEFLKSEDQYFEQLDDRLWLIDLAFLSDLMQKLNSLNTEFCREKSHISGMISSVNSFKGKLKLWKSHLHRKSLLHFPSMKQVVGEGEFNSKPFVDRLETLEDHFQARFQQLAVIEPLVAFLETPFQSVDVPDTAAVIGELCQAGVEEIERELVDLQSDVVLKSNSRHGDFWNLVDPQKFPLLRNAAAKIKSYFGSTYLSNSLFLAKKCIESENRAQLTEEQLHDCLRVALSSYTPNYNKLADDMEA